MSIELVFSLVVILLVAWLIHYSQDVDYPPPDDDDYEEGVKIAAIGALHDDYLVQDDPSSTVSGGNFDGMDDGFWDFSPPADC